MDWDFSKILLFPHDLTSRPQVQYPRTAPPLPSVWQPKLSIAAVNDPLEREADQVAEAVVNGRAPVRINGQMGGAASVQRSAVYVRAPVGTSGRIKTGPLVDWDYVVPSKCIWEILKRVCPVSMTRRNTWNVLRSAPASSVCQTRC